MGSRLRRLKDATALVCGDGCRTVRFGPKQITRDPAPFDGARCIRRSEMATAVQCPIQHTAGGGTSNIDWWPNELRVDLLHQHSAKSDPMGNGFNYAAEFRT